jgi:hypothetical protein
MRANYKILIFKLKTQNRQNSALKAIDEQSGKQLLQTLLNLTPMAPPGRKCVSAGRRIEGLSPSLSAYRNRVLYLLSRKPAEPKQ